MYNLEGKVALVTGAGGRHGIGRAIAVRLAQEGADVVVNDVKSNPHVGAVAWRGVDSVVEEIQSLGRRSMSIIADVSNARQVDAMVREVSERLGPIDILVNNAGSAAGPDRVPVVELEEDAWDMVQRVNVKGTFPMLSSSGPGDASSRPAGKNHRHLVRRGQAGHSPVRRLLHLQVCTHRLHPIPGPGACAPRHKRQRPSAPGWWIRRESPGLRQPWRREGETAEEYRARMFAERAKAIPLGRVANGADVADVAAFLASDQSDYLTGVSLPVAGGALMY